MKLVIFAAVTLMCANAAAENWKYVAENSSSDPPSRTITQVDTDSIKLRDGFRQAWVRASFFPAKRNFYGVEKQLGSNVILNIFDCKNEDVGKVQYTEYSQLFGEGAPGYSDTTPRKMAVRNMFSMMPGTVGAATLKFVCAQPLR